MIFLPADALTIFRPYWPESHSWYGKQHWLEWGVTCMSSFGFFARQWIRKPDPSSRKATEHHPGQKMEWPIHSSSLNLFESTTAWYGRIFGAQVHPPFCSYPPFTWAGEGVWHACLPLAFSLGNGSENLTHLLAKPQNITLDRKWSDRFKVVLPGTGCMFFVMPSLRPSTMYGCCGMAQMRVQDGLNSTGSPSCWFAHSRVHTLWFTGVILFAAGGLCTLLLVRHWGAFAF